MSEKNSSLMTPFDQLTSSKQLQMLKLMIPYTPPASQRMFAMYIRVMELQQTLQYFSNTRSGVYAQSFRKSFSDPALFIEEIQPYLPESEAQQMAEILNLFQMMEMVKMYQTMAESSSGANGSDESGFGMDAMSMLMGMLSPEQQAMFEMFQSMSQNDTTNFNEEGNENDE